MAEKNVRLVRGLQLALAYKETSGEVVEGNFQLIDVVMNPETNQFSFKVYSSVNQKEVVIPFHSLTSFKLRNPAVEQHERNMASQRKANNQMMANMKK